MMDKKTTDAEIIKALECCQKVLPNCRECPIEESQRIMCCDLIKGYAINLINRLQADIENYKQIAENQQKIILDKAFENKRLRTSNDALRMANELCKGWEERAKAEAYKEFAELVKANKSKLFNYIYSSKGFDNQIDNLLKEKVGEDNG